MSTLPEINRHRPRVLRVSERAITDSRTAEETPKPPGLQELGQGPARLVAAGQTDRIRGCAGRDACR
jgi:hypothetical protein